MFALIFSVDDVDYGIDVSSVIAVAPVFELEEDCSRAYPFMGWRVFENRTIPVFDLNFAISGKKAHYLFGTRHIIALAKVGDKLLRFAFSAESVSQVSELAKGSDDFFETASEKKRVKLVDISEIFSGVLFDYERQK